MSRLIAAHVVVEDGPADTTAARVMNNECCIGGFWFLMTGGTCTGRTRQQPGRRALCCSGSDSRPSIAGDQQRAAWQTADNVGRGVTRTIENLLREVAALLKQSAALKMR